MTVMDPVCGMEVNPDESNWVVQHGGGDYYFCSEGCQEVFIRDPLRYIQMRNTGYSHSEGGGHVGGCCGGGTSRGWYSYIHLAIMILFLVLLLFR